MKRDKNMLRNRNKKGISIKIFKNIYNKTKKSINHIKMKRIINIRMIIKMKNLKNITIKY